MNRNQWFVLGIGLILLSFYFSYHAEARDCDKISQANRDLMEIEDQLNEATDSSDESVSNHMSNVVVNCFRGAEQHYNYSKIFRALGILFMICSFFEPKGRKK